MREQCDLLISTVKSKGRVENIRMYIKNKNELKKIIDGIIKINTQEL